MAYEQHQWLDGEIITAEKLAHIETGIGCVSNCSKIWENPNPESSFEGQEIIVDTTPYRKLDFYFNIEEGGVWYCLLVTINKDMAYKSNGKWNAVVEYGNYKRFITLKDDKITLSDCLYVVAYNGKLIPYGIHAYE